MKRTAAVITAVAAVAPATAQGHGKGCNTRDCDVRVAHDMSRRHKLRVVAPYRAWLDKVADCESTNRPWAVSRDSRYFGLFQFDLRTWASVGGRGNPTNATRLEQKYRAVLLLKARGASPWPVCG